MGDTIIQVRFSGFSTPIKTLTIRLLTDSPLCELIDKVERTTDLTWQQLGIYDATSSGPPILLELDEKLEHAGQNSITLGSCGWFPSANLGVVPKGHALVFETSVRDDNWGGQRVEGNSTVITDDGKRQKVSEVMEAVENRFNNAELKLPPPKPKPKPKKESSSNLSEKIDKLNKIIDTSGSNKKKKISEKVRQMLIKSKAEGIKSLRQEDRFYCEVVVVRNEEKVEPQSAHMFFSLQSSVGKVADVLSHKFALPGCKLLIKTASGDVKSCGSLVYLVDLVRNKVLLQFDRIYVGSLDVEEVEEFNISKSNSK